MGYLLAGAPMIFGDVTFDGTPELIVTLTDIERLIGGVAATPIA